MAKKKRFGEGASNKNDNGKMARVVISTKLGNNKYAYKEAMVGQDHVNDYIKENKSE